MDRRLAQLGFLPGNKVRIIRSAPFHGPLLLDVEGREIVLGRRVASRIMVEYV
jgi:ferrous iron transport protein A